MLKNLKMHLAEMLYTFPVWNVYRNIRFRIRCLVDGPPKPLITKSSEPLYAHDDSTIIGRVYEATCHSHDRFGNLWIGEAKDVWPVYPHGDHWEPNEKEWQELALDAFANACRIRKRKPR